MNKFITILLIIFASFRALAESATACGIPDRTSPRYAYELAEERLVRAYRINALGLQSSWPTISAWAMDQVDWNEGFGWENGPINDVYPLSRTINAIYVLEKSGLAENCGENLIMPGCVNYLPGVCGAMAQIKLSIDAQEKILEWAGCYARSANDELDAHCYGESTTVAAAYHQWFQDSRIELYKDFFYDYTAGERAAALLHEARHMVGNCDHNGTIPGGESNQADYSWQDGCDNSNAPGAYHFQTVFLRHIALRSQHYRLPYIGQTIVPGYEDMTYLGYPIAVTRAENLMIMANATMQTSFQVRPGFRYRSTHVQKVCAWICSSSGFCYMSRYCQFYDAFGQAYTCSGANCGDDPLGITPAIPGEYQPPSIRTSAPGTYVPPPSP